MTDGSGVYRIGPVRPGVYTVTAELTGFASMKRENLELLLGQRVVLDLRMALTGVAEAVTVTGAAPLIDVTQSRVGGNIDTRQMQVLPINGRDWKQLTMLAPGARANAVGEGVFGNVGSYQLNMDGQEVTNGMSYGNVVQPKFSRESIGEFEMVTARFDVLLGGSMRRLSHMMVQVLTGLLLPCLAAAQTAGGITGVARDTSGAVLPGVTVEAASPALIEKVRVAVTDGQGQFTITDLRPGTYSVTFTLPGFATYKREGIELSAGFTATANAEMKVGGLEETVTVTGASPVVDIRNVRTQQVLKAEVLDALPTGGKNLLGVGRDDAGRRGHQLNDVGGDKDELTNRIAAAWRASYRRQAIPRRDVHQLARRQPAGAELRVQHRRLCRRRSSTPAAISPRARRAEPISTWCRRRAATDSRSTARPTTATIASRPKACRTSSSPAAPGRSRR